MLALQTPVPHPTRPLPLERVLAFRQQVQTLSSRPSDSLPELVRRIAHLPSPGGASPYLALRQRAPGLTRRELEQAVFEENSLVEAPFVRGSMIICPLEDAPALLAAARRSHQTRLQPLVRAQLLDARLLARLSEAILQQLAGGPLSVDELRARLPAPLLLGLGEQGRKAGFGSLFSVALRELQLDGSVMRRSRDKRLDRGGFEWMLPLRRIAPPPGREEALAALAGHYFRAHAPAPIAHFAFWAEANMSEARIAAAAAALSPVQVEGQKEPWWLGEEQLSSLLDFVPPSETSPLFLPFRDPLLSAAKDLSHLLPESELSRPFSDWRGRLVPGGGGHLVHHHFVVLEGRLCGIWEFDPGAQRIDWLPFTSLPSPVRQRADEAALELGEWIARELGQAPFYAPDDTHAWPDLARTVEAWAPLRG